MWLGAEQEPVPASYSTAMAVALIGGVVLMLGYRVAVNRRANADYKRTKAALPAMRKAFWATLWGAIKFGFWAFIAVALLISWVAHDVRETAGR
jgi:ABC-type Fe3+ transport system permease subunit